MKKLWCQLFHSRPMWPIHGMYKCATCHREWEAFAGDNGSRREFLATAAAAAAIAASAQPAEAQVLSAQVVLMPARDVFQQALQSYPLSKAPIAGLPVMVSVNGLLMAEGLDYALADQSVQFTGQPVAQMDSPLVQILYWVTR